MLCTKELVLSRIPEIPLVKTLNQGIPLVTVFRGIWVRGKSNIRLHGLSRASVTSAEGRERMCTQIVKYSNVA